MIHNAVNVTIHPEQQNKVNRESSLVLFQLPATVAEKQGGNRYIIIECINNKLQECLIYKESFPVFI